MKPNTAMFPGTFDPPTSGHVDIIRRCSQLFEKVYVVIGINPTKNHLFSSEERKALLDDLVKPFTNVEVVIWNGLTVDFAQKNNIPVIIRGVRTVSDFDYEFELAQTNRLINNEIEVLFMPASPEFFMTRSTSIKQMAQFGADISSMVPKQVSQAIKHKNLKQI